jgi:tRNA pseudouridine55 synthase
VNTTADAVSTASVNPRPQSVEGLLLVDKPAGLTSHDVVARVRRALRTKRVGHAGTLDPFATGLLVCAVGQATRLLPYVHGEPKVYRARIAFGIATNTDDSTGVPIAHGDVPDFARLHDALASLTGAVSQVPPAYSAKHIDGERAYTRARRGEDVQLAPVSIQVMQWHELGRGDDWIEMEITCSGGTYVRSLARDLGVAMGTVAHCASLRRLSSGALHVSRAVAIDALVPGAELPVENPLPALSDLTVQPIDDASLTALRTGRQIAATVSGARAALVAPDGRVVAVAERVSLDTGDRWQPRVVLLSPEMPA